MMIAHPTREKTEAIRSVSRMASSWPSVSAIARIGLEPDRGQEWARLEFWGRPQLDSCRVAVGIAE